MCIRDGFWLPSPLTFLKRTPASAFRSVRAHRLTLAAAVGLTPMPPTALPCPSSPSQAPDPSGRVQLTRRSAVPLPADVRIRGVAGLGSNYRLIYDETSVWAAFEPGHSMTKVCPKLNLMVSAAFFVGPSGDLAILDRVSSTVVRASRGGKCSTWFRVPHTPGSFVAAAWRNSQLAILTAHPEGGLSVLRLDSLGQRRLQTPSPFRHDSNWLFLTANEKGWIAGAHDSPLWRGLEEPTGRQWGPSPGSPSRDTTRATNQQSARYYYGPVVTLGSIYLQTRTTLSTGAYEALVFDHAGTRIANNAAPAKVAFVAGVPGDSLVLGLERGDINRLITFARVGSRDTLLREGGAP